MKPLFMPTFTLAHPLGAGTTVVRTKKFGRLSSKVHSGIRHEAGIDFSAAIGWKKVSARIANRHL